MPFKDPAAQRASEHRWERNHRAQRREAQRVRRLEQRKRFLEFKQTLSCKTCGESHPATLDFHHRDPAEKEVSLGYATGRLDWSWEKLMEEVAKCDVLCSNCHRKWHFDNQV